METPLELCTAEEAAMFRAAHSAYVGRVSRMSRGRLADLHRADLAEQGRQILFGGPVTKDELVRALVELHYPTARLNMTTHVLHHGEADWSACEYCAVEAGRCVPCVRACCPCGEARGQDCWRPAEHHAAARS
jgi:hypothetical protein